MPESEEALLSELAALYARSDALFAEASCAHSSECCRFGITGREPQVTSIEMAQVAKALKARGGPLASKKRALPLHGHRGDERTCPMLDQGSRCAIYTARPLGCRTFFCERAELPSKPSRQELKRLVRELEDLATRHRPQGAKPHAFTRALQALK